jgi:hypothetical protein
MRNRWLVWLLAFVVCEVCSGTRGEAGQSSSAEPYAGTWSGIWDGSGSGEFELKLEKSKDGAVTGRVAVTTDGGNYTAELKALSFDGKKMTATYDFPLDTSSEIAMTGTFEDQAAKGTWGLRTKGQEAEVVSGTWTVTRK